MNIKEKIEKNRILNHQLLADFNSIHCEIQKNWPSLQFLLHDIFVAYSGKYYSNNSVTQFKIIKKGGIYIWLPLIVSKGIPIFFNKWIKFLIRFFGKKEFRVVLSQHQLDNIRSDYEKFLQVMLSDGIRIPTFESILKSDICVYNTVLLRPFILLGGSAAHLSVASTLLNFTPRLSIGFNHHSKSINDLEEPIFTIIESQGYKVYYDYIDANRLIYNQNKLKIKNYTSTEIFYIPTSIGNYQYGPYRNLDDNDYLDWQIFIINYLKKYELPVTVIKHPKGQEIKYAEYCTEINEIDGLNGILPGGNAVVIIDYISSVLSQLMDNSVSFIFLDLHSRNPSSYFLQKIKESGDYLDLSIISNDLRELDTLIHERING